MKEELFNLHHAQLHNVIEHIFGVIKQKFQILLLAPKYDLDLQIRLPAALCAIHNFTREHDSEITALDTLIMNFIMEVAYMRWKEWEQMILKLWI